VSAGSADRARRPPAGGEAVAPADVWVALCTAPDADTAARLGRGAVEGGHAACANLLPGVRSLFRWEGEVQEEGETLIVFKTTSAAWRGLAELVARDHPYEVPELIAFPLAAGLEAYLRWVRESTRPAPAGARVDSPTGSA
jgi:periplasmic divalent cation tolerance protein